MASEHYLYITTIRRGAKVFGELGRVAQIAVDGMGRVVANLHVFEHALPQPCGGCRG